MVEHVCFTIDARWKMWKSELWGQFSDAWNFEEPPCLQILKCIFCHGLNLISCWSTLRVPQLIPAAHYQNCDAIRCFENHWNHPFWLGFHVKNMMILQQFKCPFSRRIRHLYQLLKAASRARFEVKVLSGAPSHWVTSFSTSWMSPCTWCDIGIAMTMPDTGRAQLLLKMMKMFSCRYVISQICQNISNQFLLKFVWFLRFRCMIQ